MTNAELLAVQRVERLCKDCAHIKICHMKDKDEDYKLSSCAFLDRVRQDPVSGRKWLDRVNCYDARKPQGQCGPEGFYWKARLQIIGEAT